MIKHEMPYCPNGLRETWKHIGGILQKQQEDPSYVYKAEVPKEYPAP